MSCFGQNPYFIRPNRSKPPLSFRAATAICSLLGEMTEMGSCSSATARTRRPVPAARRCPEAPAATAGGKVLTSVTVTPGKGRGLRQEPGGQAAAAKPGRGVPANAAVTRPSSSVPPAAPGGGDAGSAALRGRGGLCSPCSAVDQYREPAAPSAALPAAERPDPPGSRAGGQRGAALPRAAASRGSLLRKASRQGSAGAPRRRSRPAAVCPCPAGPLRRSSSCRTRRWTWAAAAPST